MINISAVIVVVLYAIIDVFYVLRSRAFYEGVAKGISGSNFPSGRMGVALATYSLLILAFVFAVPALYQKYFFGLGMTKGYAVSGALFGLVVYGVFNGTNAAMFEGWGKVVSFRDIMWGITVGLSMGAVYGAMTPRFTN